MTDIATAYNFDPTTGIGPYCDWSLSGPDLASDQGLLSAVLISLFTDRMASADDELPDNSGDRRGWWGDLPLDSSGTPDLIGSRLWLLVRQKQTTKVLNAAIGYAQEALKWLVDDGVAAAVNVIGAWGGLGILKLRVTVSRITATGATVNHGYDLIWNSTMAALPAPAGA